MPLLHSRGNISRLTFAFATQVVLFFSSCRGLDLHLFTPDIIKNFSAVCLDGSPSGYYFSPATTQDNRTKFVMFLEGGGSCVEWIDCYKRAETTKGSSRDWPSEWHDETGLLSNNSHLNPLASWNRIWVRYCSGDDHTGSETAPNLGGLQFSGHQQMEAIASIFASSWNNASHFILSGGSAGGVGALNHANWLRAKLPQTCKTKVVPQAGYFFALDVVSFPQWLIDDYDPPFAVEATRYLRYWYSAYVDPICEAREKNTDLCLSASTLLPYIQDPVFLANNLFDAVQVHLTSIKEF